jgi:hypothetical protein
MVLTSDFLGYQTSSNELHLCQLKGLKELWAHSNDGGLKITPGLTLVQRRNELVVFFTKKDFNDEFIYVVRLLFKRDTDGKIDQDLIASSVKATPANLLYPINQNRLEITTLLGS